MLLLLIILLQECYSWCWTSFCFLSNWLSLWVFSCLSIRWCSYSLAALFAFIFFTVIFIHLLNLFDNCLLFLALYIRWHSAKPSCLVCCNCKINVSFPKNIVHFLLIFFGLRRLVLNILLRWHLANSTKRPPLPTVIWSLYDRIHFLVNWYFIATNNYVAIMLPLRHYFHPNIHQNLHRFQESSLNWGRHLQLLIYSFERIITSSILLLYFKLIIMIATH